MQEPTLGFELCPQELHSFIRDIIRQIHMETGARAEIILPTVLGTMAAACQDCFDVQLREGLVSPVSLYTIILAPSGTRKTTVHNIVTKSIKEMEKEFHAEFRKDQALYTKERALWQIEYKAAEKRYRKILEVGSDPTDALLSLRSVQEKDPLKPLKKQLTINDLTSEALIKTLAEGYPSISIMSDEAGGLFDGNLFRKSPLFNAIWSGQRINSVRASRREYSVEDPKLVLLAMLQSELYDRYLFSHGEYLRTSGFMARCLLVDLKQVRKPYSTDAYSICNVNALDTFHTLVRQYILQGVNRRICNVPRNCITLAKDASELYEHSSKRFYDLIQPGNVLEAYDDLGARFMEQSIRIAAVMQVFITPGSAEITFDVLKAAIHIMNWHLDHMIAKLNCSRKRSDAEKLEDWLEEHLVANQSYDFRRNDIIKKGPYSVRNIDRLLTALNKLEASGKIQQFKQGNANYIKFTGSKMSPCELGEQLGLPNWAIGSVSMGKLPL